LEPRLKALPTKPGVYLFKDAKGQVLYVGKAKSLRPRVRSYFQANPDARAAIQQLPERVADIEVIVTGNEVEALHLEQNLVKRHRPPFNVRLRDDKSFPYIAVTVEDEYPRVMFTRERHRRGVVYFGPYANAKKVRGTLDVLNRVFQFRRRPQCRRLRPIGRFWRPRTTADQDQNCEQRKRCAVHRLPSGSTISSTRWPAGSQRTRAACVSAGVSDV
jgi:excinuclease ABC subunit C